MHGDQEETDVTTIIDDARRSERMRQVNDAMWEGLSSGSYSEPIAFFCECADPGCYQAVWLTSEEYASARVDPVWIALQAGHRGAVPELDEAR